MLASFLKGAQGVSSLMWMEFAVRITLPDADLTTKLNSMLTVSRSKLLGHSPRHRSFFEIKGQPFPVTENLVLLMLHKNKYNKSRSCSAS